MKISTYTGGMVQTNGYLLETPEGNYLIDAPAGVAEWLAGKGVRVDALYLTHQHYDHVEDVARLRKSGVKVCAWAAYSKELTLENHAAGWGLPEVQPYRVDELIGEGDGIHFGRKVRVSHVPGHSPDSITFYFDDADAVFVGDALFAGSVGRCDLPGGDLDLLIDGIRKKLLVLPDHTRVFSGHGPATSIGRERIANAYLG